MMEATTEEKFPTEELSAEMEASLVQAFQQVQVSVSRLLDTMDSNAALLEDSVREVRTARQIAAESNRMARRRVMREGVPALRVTSRLVVIGVVPSIPARAYAALYRPLQNR